MIPVKQQIYSSLKVMHLINGEYYAGAERVQDYLALQLPEFGVQVEFACLKPRDFSRHTLTTDVPILDFHMASKLDISVIKRIVKYLKFNNFDLIHTHTPRSSLVGSAVSKFTGLPMVHHVHSPTNSDTEFFWRNTINSYVEKLSLKRARQLIAVSEAMKRYVAVKGIDENKITVVHNGVPIQNKVIVRKCPEGRWVLGIVAFFRPRKGLDDLIEALYQLREKGYNVYLRIIGAFETAEYEKKIHCQVNNLSLQSSIKWVGFSDNVIDELRKIDLFVLPSLYGEGLPMVVLEAMSVGVPVVATHVEGIPEAVRDGVDGCLARPGNTASLVNAITAIISGEKDWEKMSESAKERQRCNFSDMSMARGVNAVYRKILSVL